MDPIISITATMSHVFASTIVSGLYPGSHMLTSEQKKRLNDIFHIAIGFLERQEYLNYHTLIQDIIDIVGNVENVEYEYEVIEDEGEELYQFRFDFTNTVFEVAPIPIPNDVLQELYAQ